MFKKNKIIIFTLIGLITITSQSFAAKDFAGVVQGLGDNFMGILVKLAFALAGLYFFIGVFQFVYKANDSSAMAEGKKRITFSIIALLVMFSLMGIVSMMKKTADLNDGNLKVKFYKVK